MDSDVFANALGAEQLDAVRAHVSDEFLGVDGAVVVDEILLWVEIGGQVGGEEGAGGARVGEGVVVGGLVLFVEEVHVVHGGIEI